LINADKHFQRIPTQDNQYITWWCDTWNGMAQFWTILLKLLNAVAECTQFFPNGSSCCHRADSVQILQYYCLQCIYSALF